MRDGEERVGSDRERELRVELDSALLARLSRHIVRDERSRVEIEVLLEHASGTEDGHTPLLRVVLEEADLQHLCELAEAHFHSTGSVL